MDADFLLLYFSRALCALENRELAISLRKDGFILMEICVKQRKSVVKYFFTLRLITQQQIETCKFLRTCQIIGNKLPFTLKHG